MTTIFPSNYKEHNPPYEIFNGNQEPHNEVPERLDNILISLNKHGHSVKPASLVVPNKILLSIHHEKYLSFLQTASKRLSEKQYQYPSVFMYKGGQSTKNNLGQLGEFSFDLYTPLLHKTFEVAKESASCAYEVSVMLKQKKIKSGYALCRPPGHHAQKAQMGGYCYLNNAAVAAEVLSSNGKVAILDIDFHHGNGTQEIFYDRSDVFTQSIHASPNWKFPFFSGFKNEIGIEKGKNFNQNFPLNKGTTDEQYNPVLKKSLHNIRKFDPQFLVVSLGEDIHKSDPIGGFQITTKYFRQIAKQISDLSLPTVLIQEGGYNTTELGNNVSSFLDGFA